MKKRKLIAFTALTILTLGGVTMGITKTMVSVVHAQTSTVQAERVKTEVQDTKDNSIKENGKETLDEASDPKNYQAKIGDNPNSQLDRKD